MNSTNEPNRAWQKVVAELDAYARQQLGDWGGLEDVVLAAYLAGTCSEQERKAVDQAIREQPVVKELIEKMRKLLQPAWIVPEAEKAPVLGPKRPGAKVLRECLRSWLDDAGRLTASGLEMLMGESGPAGASSGAPMGGDVALSGSGAEVSPEWAPQVPESPSARECYWKIPVDEAGYNLTIRTKPAPKKGYWLLYCDIASESEPEIAARVRFSLSQPDDLPLIQSRMAEFLGKPIPIGVGQWELAIKAGDDVRVVPLEVGTSPEPS